MNTINDVELTTYISKLQLDARALNALEREGQGYELLKALHRIELAAQLAQQRLAEIK
jgi:hypothetical protein